MVDLLVANRIVSFCVPFALLGAVAYASWVFCDRLCVDYLLNTKNRDSVAIGLLVGYIILFILFVTAYLRTFLTINLAAGYIKKGPKFRGQSSASHRGPPKSKKWHLESKSTAQKRAAREAADIEKGRRSAAGGAGRVSLSGGTTSGTSSSGSDSTAPAQTAPYTPGPMSHNMMGGAYHESTPSTHGSSSHGASSSEGGSHYYSRYPERPAGLRDHEKPKGLKNFWQRDVFICENDGLPKWCSHCNVWKPDRSHHSREVARCVRKEDHVCPWVGGVIGETSYKFFAQTVFYGALYCIYMLVCLAVFFGGMVADKDSIDKNWTATLVLSAAFSFFTAGMTLSTYQLMSKNVSTIENLSHKTKQYYLAIYDDSLTPYSETSQANLPLQNGSSRAPPVTQITFPLPKSHPYYDPDDLLFSMKPRTFRVVQTEPGENPFDLGSKFENCAEVMGYHVWEWIFPLTRSPLEKKGWTKYNRSLIQRYLRQSRIRMPEDEI